MSKENLEIFLKKIDTEMKKGKASKIWRAETGDKLTTILTVDIEKITKTIKAAVDAATNVTTNGDTLIKEIETEYNALTNALMTTLRTKFKALAKPNSGVKVLEGSVKGNRIRVKLDKLESSNRDNFHTGGDVATAALQTFYGAFVVLIGKVLERESAKTKGKIIKQKAQGQVFNIEHIKGKSNVQGFINDKIKEAIEEHVNNPEKKDTLKNLEADIASLGLKTYLKIEKNAKDGEIKAYVYVGSEAENVAQSSSEKKIKTDLQKALKKALERLKDEAFKTQGSDSLKDAKRKQVLEKTFKPFKKLKNVKVKASSTKIEESKGPARLDVSGKTVRGKLARVKLRKKQVKASASPASNMLQYIAMINKELPDTVKKNMREPALVNRTGRFAESVRLTDIVPTPRGFPSIGYTYQKNPYQVFEDGALGSAPWANGKRDPRKLIDRSIREIATQLAIGRFFTRRV